MYSYDEIIGMLRIDNDVINRNYIKTIINALIKNGSATVYKQKICVDLNDVMYLWNFLNEISIFFDYRYNTKIDLTNFLYYVLNKDEIVVNAIFCPGYTETGYKDYIGSNNSSKLKTLKELKQFMCKLNIQTKFSITLADIFLENTNDILNPNWKNELNYHIEKFIEKAMTYFEAKEVVILSELFKEPKYIKGFIDDNIKIDKIYQNFYKNNLDFYKKMGWDEKEIRIRNDKLFTIYNIISDYINSQKNGIYTPMETMYSRSKVMTMNKVCTMYLYK